MELQVRGKTEIYLQLIEKALSLGKSAIMLVPEISLTPQIVDRFLARFGEQIAILHSKLSNGERYDEWQKIVEGKAKIVIGARSAIFAPVKNLGIIIIDEEHDMSYKSDMAPRYHAKDLAKYIAEKSNCPLVLGSATPDVATYKQALDNEIAIFKLSKRANNASLPEVQIVDLRQELAYGNRSMISEKLKLEIEKNLKDKKQTILFLNRRGYSTFVLCRECGEPVKCPNCNISLTYHKYENRLKCHYCGLQMPALKKCPNCGSDKIKYFGTGTQKLEDEVAKMFPEATTIRMDIDTVSKKNSHEEILNKFKNENINILIGTQMIVKGHHFPNVTLVGVIVADGALNMEDYNAAQKTFQTLVQVAGRAGREKEKGRVIIQTYNPDHYAINYASKQDYELFYNAEINLRKMLKYPPFCDIIMIRFVGKNIGEIEKLSREVFDNLQKLVDKTNTLVYKPLPAPVDKIKNKYRWRIIIKGKVNSKLLNILYKAIEVKIKEDTSITVDINPNNMI
jgi:primosomal protein N' (replication factor Y)